MRTKGLLLYIPLQTSQEALSCGPAWPETQRRESSGTCSPACQTDSITPFQFDTQTQLTEPHLTPQKDQGEAMPVPNRAPYPECEEKPTKPETRVRGGQWEGPCSLARREVTVTGKYYF